MEYRVRAVKSVGKGWGVQSLEEIPVGRYLCDYTGCLVSPDHQNDVGAHSTYVLQVRCAACSRAAARAHH